jgi:tetratricopeptide (TPR) repeat protein
VGLALGALALTRENALLLVPAVLGWTWLHWRPLGVARLRLGAVLLVGLAVVLLPVAVRNRLVGGEFHLTTAQSGPNFYIGNNPQADGTYMSLRFGRGSPEYERLDATELAEEAIGRALSPGEVSSFWTERALAYIRAQPLDWAALLWRKFRLLWNVTEVVDTESQETHADWSRLLRILGPVAHFGVLAPLALIGMWITWGERRRLGLLYAMLGAYALSVLAFYVVGRYRLPLAPFLMVFASAAVVRGRRFLSARNPVERGIAAGLVAGIMIFCNWPAVSQDLMRAVTYHNLGEALQSDEQLDDAVRAYERALGLRPDYAPSHNNLGAVLRERGKLDEAIDHLEEALRLRPDFVEAAYNLANALAAKGNLDEAVAQYRNVLELAPDAVDVRSNLGIALATQGKLDEATEQFRKAVALAPQTANPHYNLGNALLTRGTVNEAIEHLSQALQIDPAHVSARYELANAYLAQERFEQAVAQYREAIQLSPRFVEAHNNLGIALGSMGRMSEAIEQFRAALQIDPSYGEAQANLQNMLATQLDRK